MTSLYGSLPSSVVFALKQRLLGKHYKSLWVPDLTCHLEHAKQRDLYQNDKSTCVPVLICVFFCMQNSDFRSSLINLYGSQTSSVVLSTHNCVINARVSRLYGFQPSPKGKLHTHTHSLSNMTFIVIYSSWHCMTFIVIYSSHISVMSTSQRSSVGISWQHTWPYSRPQSPLQW